MTTKTRASYSTAMQRIVDQMGRVRHRQMYEMTPLKAREYYARNGSVLDLPSAVLQRVEDFHIPTHDDVMLPARLYAPSENAGLPVLLFFHGGGFVVGSIATHDSLCRQLALRSGAAVISLEYRLAPENRFPTAINDAWAACEWIYEFGHTLAVDGSRLAVGGDSAGGTIAAVCAIMARDARLPIALQMLFYPGLTANQDTASHQVYADDPIIPEKLITWFFHQYIDDDVRTDWRFAPLCCDDLHGVAPAWFGLSECDPLFDEGMAYADRLRFAGVKVDLEIYRGVTHEFAKFGMALPQAVAAQKAAALTLAQVFGLTPQA